MKSKPLPPLRSLEKRVMKEEEEEEEIEEMEMKELVVNTEEDKDDYYFEDPSNISESSGILLCVCIFTLCFIQ